MASARALVGLVGIAAVLVLTGCTEPAAGHRAGHRAAPTPSLAAELVQLRSDVADRQAEVRLHNGGAAPVEIGAVRLHDSRFTEPATRVVAGRTSTLGPGGTVDIRVQLTPAACPGADDAGDDAADDAVDPTVELAVDGATLTIPAPDTLGFVGPLHERECRDQALEAAADVALTGFTPSSSGQPAALQLTVTPTGAGAALLTGIQTTNLLTFADPADPASGTLTYALDIAVAPGDAAPVVVDLPLLPFRCDPHAVQEDKRGTVFGLQVRLDGVDGLVDLAASDDLRGRILAWVGQWCGFGQ